MILQPRYGTHLNHALAAISNMSISGVKEAADGWFDNSEVVTSDHRWFEDDPRKKVTVREFGRMWCDLFGLDPDEQPVNLIEDAIEIERNRRISCLEVVLDPFVQMIFCIYGEATPRENRSWDTLGLNSVFVRRHFVEVGSED